MELRSPVAYTSCSCSSANGSFRTWHPRRIETFFARNVQRAGVRCAIHHARWRILLLILGLRTFLGVFFLGRFEAEIGPENCSATKGPSSFSQGFAMHTRPDWICEKREFRARVSPLPPLTKSSGTEKSCMTGTLRVPREIGHWLPVLRGLSLFASPPQPEL